MNGPQTIDEYLDELLWELRGREPSVVRRVMAETEDHLREAMGRAEAGGAVSPAQAESSAISAFGSPQRLARALPRWRPRLSMMLLLRQATLLAAGVCITVGVSGVLLIAGALVEPRWVVRENSYTIDLPATGPCGYLERGTDRPCPTDVFLSFEETALRAKLREEIPTRLAVGALGALLLFGGLRLPASTRALIRPARKTAPAMSLMVHGFFAVVCVWVGIGLMTTVGRNGGGWFLAYGVAACFSFAASWLWLQRSTLARDATGIVRRSAV